MNEATMNVASRYTVYILEKKQKQNKTIALVPLRLFPNIMSLATSLSSLAEKIKSNQIRTVNFGIHWILIRTRRKNNKFTKSLGKRF